MRGDKCIICGGEVSFLSNNKSLCSEQCKIKNNALKQKAYRDRTKPKVDYELRKCAWCGVEFKPRTKVQARCSTECSRLWLEKYLYAPRRKRISEIKLSEKQKKLNTELEGKTFAQALADKYGLSLEADK